MVIARISIAALISVIVSGSMEAQTQAPLQVTAIRAGRLIDPETGSVSANQVILVEGTRIRQIGSNLTIPAGANVVDLSELSILPGLVDAHNHLALTYKQEPESNIYSQLCATWATTELRRHGAPRRNRARVVAGPHDHQFRNHHWRNGRSIQSHAGNGERSQPRLPGIPGCRHTTKSSADLIGVRGNPLEDIDALRSVQFVMKDGMVFKQNGVVTSEKFFHGGPVNGWRIR